MNVSIACENLSFYYEPTQQVLNNLTLQFMQGERCAIIGNNGAGKTTLAKIMSGLLKPSAGSLYIDNKDTSKLTQSTIASMVGYIFQNPDDQIFNTTVRKEITYAIRHIDETYYRQILQLTGLEHVESSSPFSLTVSERKFVNIATTLLRKPKIIIMDEASGGLDRSQLTRLEHILSFLSDEHITVLLITHDMNVAYQYCERILILARGQALYHGVQTQAFSDPNIIQQAHIKQPLIVRALQAANLVETTNSHAQSLNLLAEVLRKHM